LKAKAVATHDGVNVARDFSRADNGIGTLNRDRAVAEKSEEGVRWCSKSYHQAHQSGVGKTFRRHLEDIWDFD
jgi:hypothetical protein